MKDQKKSEAQFGSGFNSVGLREAYIEAVEKASELLSKKFRKDAGGKIGNLILMLDDLDAYVDRLLVSKLFADIDANAPENSEGHLFILEKFNLGNKLKFLEFLVKGRKKPEFLFVDLNSLSKFRNDLAHPRNLKRVLKLQFSYRGSEKDFLTEEGSIIFYRMVLEVIEKLKILFPEIDKHKTKIKSLRQGKYLAKALLAIGKNGVD